MTRVWRCFEYQGKVHNVWNICIGKIRNLKKVAKSFSFCIVKVPRPNERWSSGEFFTFDSILIYSICQMTGSTECARGTERYKWRAIKWKHEVISHYPASINHLQSIYLSQPFFYSFGWNNGKNGKIQNFHR